MLFFFNQRCFGILFVCFAVKGFVPWDRWKEVLFPSWIEVGVDPVGLIDYADTIFAQVPPRSLT